MSTNQACGEPQWYMKRESDRVFGDRQVTYGDLNGVYTVSNLPSPSDDSGILKATVDGVALKAGDLVAISSCGTVIEPGSFVSLADCANDGQYLAAAGGSCSFTEFDYDITLQVTDNWTISFKEMDERITRLERQVELWKSAAMTLKEINDQLQEAAEADRMDEQVDFGKPKTSESQRYIATLCENMRTKRADEAYEYAKKFTR